MTNYAQSLAAQTDLCDPEVLGVRNLGISELGLMGEGFGKVTGYISRALRPDEIQLGLQVGRNSASKWTLTALNRSQFTVL